MSKSKYYSTTLIDQGFVSGVNFLTSIILARLLGIDQYGKFVLLYAAILYANTFQSAIITMPMASILPKKTNANEKKIYIQGVFTLQIFISFISSIFIVGILYFQSKFIDIDNYIDYFTPMASAIVFIQLQDLMRRYYYSDLRPAKSLISDLISYGGQLIAIILIHASEGLTVKSAIWAIAATSAISFCFGWIKESIIFNLRDAFIVSKQHFSMAKDFLISGQLQWIGSQGVLMLAGYFLGPASSGGIRAAQNIIGPINILYQAMENVVPVKAAQTFAQFGISGLRQYLSKVNIIGGSTVISICIVLSLLSEKLIQLTYGIDYLKFSKLIILQSIYIILGFYYRQFSYFYRSINCTKIIVTTTIATSMSSITIALILIPFFKEYGMMCSIIIGQLIGIIFISKNYNKLYKTNNDSQY